MPFADLTGRIAIVTGGAGALGRATNRVLLDAGATIITTDTHGHGMRDLAASLPDDIRPRLVTIEADITTEEGAAAVVRRGTEAFGGIDILVNIVGGYAGGPAVAETDPTTWSEQFRLNATTAFLMA